MKQITTQFEDVLVALHDSLDNTREEAVAARFKIIGGKKPATLIVGLARADAGLFRMVYKCNGGDLITADSIMPFTDGHPRLNVDLEFDIKLLGHSGDELVPAPGLDTDVARVMGVRLSSKPIDGIGITQLMHGPRSLMNAVIDKEREGPKPPPDVLDWS